jgi:hypothetical protein
MAPPIILHECQMGILVAYLQCGQYSNIHTTSCLGVYRIPHLCNMGILDKPMRCHSDHLRNDRWLFYTSPHPRRINQYTDVFCRIFHTKQPSLSVSTGSLMYPGDMIFSAHCSSIQSHKALMYSSVPRMSMFFMVTLSFLLAC